ncbi:hypothetical protein AWW68_12585 [Roseivirga spongicola]|uniref:Uncharacterized protein n=1 Tax=Roseivirga spongicola TaxID=333140 RepID=A0A150X482_9BACT|nr:hypothetical protein [Roseivirga spongicola]KYG73523.1 hypothetical protein AWW68_12585 [Roseivirga spongicola]
MASARLKGNIFEPHANYSIYFKLGYYTTHLIFVTDGLSVSTEDQLEKTKLIAQLFYDHS